MSTSNRPSHAVPVADVLALLKQAATDLRPRTAEALLSRLSATRRPARPGAPDYRVLVAFRRCKRARRIYLAERALAEESR